MPSAEPVMDYFDRQANAALTLGLAPQLLTEDELMGTTLSWVGWEFLANTLTRSLRDWTDAFGGDIVDSALKAKIQCWLQGWTKAPGSYPIHVPTTANGQWIRIFRTTMNLSKRLEAFKRDYDTKVESEVVAEWERHLGLGSRDRHTGYRSWCQAVRVFLAGMNQAVAMEFEEDVKRFQEADILTKYRETVLPYVKRDAFTGYTEWALNTIDAIRVGEWHIAVYNPAWEAFVSPFGTDDEETLALSSSSIDRYRMEFPHIPIQLYPTRPGVGFNLSLAIFEGAMVELLGDRNELPPFGSAWGDGVILDRLGGSRDRRIAGIIHKHSSGTQTFRVREEPQGYIQMDPPDPFSLIQDVYWSTGYLPNKGIAQELMALDRIADFAEAWASTFANPDSPTMLVIPKQQFLDAVLTNPALTPVYGRIISISPLLRG
jgi:hypothetical protein